MRLKCGPSLADRLRWYLNKGEYRRYVKKHERQERLNGWHDFFVFYGRIDGFCVFFETVERKRTGVRWVRGRGYSTYETTWELRLKEKKKGQDCDSSYYR